MYANLFDPIAVKNAKDREWDIRWTIQYYLKDILRLCKQGMYYVAKRDLIMFRGMLQYMKIVGDIEEMQRKFIYGITNQIEEKYDLYLY